MLFIETDTGYILIDTGGSNKRTDLEKELASAGCKPGYLKLIVLTHGDFDQFSMILSTTQRQRMPVSKD